MSSIKYTFGETVIKCKPFVHCLKEAKKKTLCDNCLGPIVGQTMKTVVECEECLHMFYCSQECKDNDSPVHRMECPVLTKDYLYMAYDFCRLLLRLYLMIINDHKSRRRTRPYKGIDGKNRTFNDLKTNSEQIKSDPKRMQIFDYCLETIDFDMSSVLDLEVDSKVLFEIFCKLTSNQTGIVHFFDWHKTEVIGSGLYMECSDISHSCMPNCAPIFDGSHIVIKAIKSIGIGEELTINYTQLEVCREKRHLILRNVFYQECHCLKCVSNDFDIDYKEFDSLRNRIMSQVKSRYPKWALVNKLSDRWLDLCTATYGEYHPQTIVYMLRILSYKIQDMDRRGFIKLMTKLDFLIDRIYDKEHPLREMFDYCLKYKCILDFE